MNVSLICLSLRYLSNKVHYKNIVKVSRWFYDELVKYSYNDDKLARALNKKDYEIIKSIITFVQDKSIFNKYLPVYYYNFDMLKLLIDNGANIRNSNILWYISCYYKQYETIKLLIDNGADIHTQNDYPLMAASRDDYDVVKLLIDNGVNINAQKDKALRTAIFCNNLDIAQLLIDNGASIHARKNEMLKHLYKHNNHEAIEFLIDNEVKTELS